MTNYTPDEEQMRYRASLVCHQGGCNIEDQGKAAEFDRFIAKVKADAWDEGELAGLRRADYGYGQSPNFPRVNPYRQEDER